MKNDQQHLEPPAGTPASDDLDGDDSGFDLGAFRAAQVRAWRVERFTAMIAPHAWGPDPDEYAADLADRLADARGDDGFPVCLHRFEGLLAAGCDPDIAAYLLDRDAPQVGAYS